MRTVNYLGPTDSYSYLLATQVFNTDDYLLNSRPNFTDVVKQTKDEAIGILPIENSITSDIHENIDALFHGNFYIIGEGYLKINLNLIANKGALVADITDVYSHPRALLQCGQYINKHKLIAHETTSTSDGVHYLKDNLHCAVIGSQHLVNRGKLQILDKNIGNVSINMTRFVFISTNKETDFSKQKNKATIIFTVRHEPGGLSRVLDVLTKCDMNITKIESRPIPGTNWEYNFWIDIENSNLSKNVVKNMFSDTTISYRILGIYQKGTVFES